MQQTPQLMNITTEQIQKYLDENKQLIMAILENQNQGKFTETASYQAQLQQNLMYLAKIADAQPQAQTSSQMPPLSAVQQEQYAQSAQAAMAKQQNPGLADMRLPFQLNEQQQPIYLQQQQLGQPQMGLRSTASTGTYQGLQTGLGNNFMNIQGNKQDCSEDGADEGLLNAAYGHSTRKA